MGFRTVLELGRINFTSPNYRLYVNLESLKVYPYFEVRDDIQENSWASAVELAGHPGKPARLAPTYLQLAVNDASYEPAQFTASVAAKVSLDEKSRLKYLN